MISRVLKRTSLIVAQITTLAFVFSMPPDQSDAADFVAFQSSAGVLDIKMSGLIDDGDTQKLQQLIDGNLRQFGGQPEIQIDLDSMGGSLLEGINLGFMFHSLAAATYVHKGNACYSACALAFLGGSYKAAVGDKWGPDRNLEIGADLGFHSFFLDGEDAEKKVPAAEAVRRGKLDALAVVAYANKLNVDIQFILDAMHYEHKDKVIHVNTVERLQTLQISVAGLPLIKSITDEMAVNVCNNATEWKRPVSLTPTSSGMSQARVTQITPDNFRRFALDAISDGLDKQPISHLIRNVLKAGSSEQISDLYDNAALLGVLPYIQWDKRVIHVDGYNYGAGFYTSDCFIFPMSEGSDNLRFKVRTFYLGHFDQIEFPTSRMSQRENWELLDPAMVVIPVR